LNRDTVELENYLFLGCTLWSDIPEEQELEYEMRINDYRKIKVNEKEEFTVKYQNQLNKIDIKWIEEQVKKNKDKQIVVLTHHVKNKKLKFRLLQKKIPY
jgi:hypothetical protein